MTFRQLAAHRRSVRNFAERRVEDKVIAEILETTFTAPSSKNSRTTRIAVSSDKEILRTISLMRSSGSAFVKDAPMVFIIMGDDSQTDLWRENSSISATVLQYAAESLGLGSCWVHVNGRPHSEDDPGGLTAEEYLRKNIPALPNYRILCVIAAGYPAAEHTPRVPQDNSGKVFFI